MQKNRVVLMDDELHSTENLRLIINQYFPELTIIKSFNEPLACLEYIKFNEFDLLFLDIKMPKINGFELISKLDRINFEIIFVTAFDHYAIKALRNGALDYVMKPIDIDDLREALVRFQKKQKDKNYYFALETISLQEQPKEVGRIALPFFDGIHFISPDQIVQVSASGNYSYVTLKTSKEKLLISKSLKQFEDLLDEHQFCRVHHGHIINLQHVEKFMKEDGGVVILSNGDRVDVSRRKREIFLEKIKQF